MDAALLTVIETFLAGLIVAGTFVMAGSLIERRFGIPSAGAPTARFNAAYYAPASLAQNLLQPVAGAVTVLAANAAGGGLIALPTRGWGFVAGLLVYLVTMDLGEYLFHRAQHRFPLLWALHSLHHSDESFNVSTAVRHFWLDSFIKSLTIYLVVGLLLKVDDRMVALYGVLTYYNYVAHLNVRMGFGRWAALLNSPQYHRLHHSQRASDHNVNFAALLPVFDVLFGTYRPPRRDEYPDTGLDTREPPPTLWQALIWPLRRRGHRPGGAPAGLAVVEMER